MKIGILTYHRAHNYGAILQAVATRVFLERHGHEVYYIDYWPEYHQNSYKIFNKRAFNRANILKKVVILLKFMFNYWGAKKRIAAFTPFIDQYITPFCKDYDSNEEYDVIIYGSDQIWRKQAGMKRRFNPVYFGENNMKADKHIAYAASMGEINLDEDDKRFLESSLSKMSMVGVREQDLYDTLKNLQIHNLSLVLDPTLLLTSEEWDKLVPNERIIKEKYVLLYQIGKSIRRRDAKKFAKSKGLKLVVLSSIYNFRYPNDVIGTPNDFISLVKNAEYVLSGSFHGLAFAINYSRQVFAAFSGNTNRALTLLKKLGIENQLLQEKTSIPSNQMGLDYERIHSKLYVSRKDCQNVLLESIR